MTSLVLASPEHFHSIRKNSAFNVIYQRVALVSCREEIPDNNGIVFPYYVPETIDDTERENLRREIAKTLVQGMINYSDRKPLCGCRAGIINVDRIFPLSMSQIDKLYTWTNVIRNFPGVGVSLWGNSYYINGTFIEAGIVPMLLNCLVLS